MVFAFNQPIAGAGVGGVTGAGQFLFAIFIGLSFGFLALAVFGRTISMLKTAPSAFLMGIIIWAGITFGPTLFQKWGVINGSYPPYALVSLSTAGTIGSIQLPFAFLINGADYTWLFVLLVFGILYYTFDDWWMWLHGRF